jgi:phosphoglycerate dehydrogenase-like enzyme
MIRIIHHRGFQDFDLTTHCGGLAGIELIGVDSPDAMAALAPSADGVMFTVAGYTEAVAASCRAPGSRVRWIQFMSAGIETAERFGVPDGCVITNASSAWAPTVAEHAVALILALMRGVHRLERDRAAQVWDRKALLPAISTLEGAQVGILGYGAIGEAMARRLHGFGATVHGIARSDRPKPGADVMHKVDDLCAVAGMLDVLCSAIPLGPATRHIVDDRVLGCLPAHALVVNVGRGPTMDEDALARRLAAGHLAGAALDVFATEPLPAASPLWGLPNAILSPHVAAFGGQAGWNRLGTLCRGNMERFRDGEALVDLVQMGSRA